MTSAPQLESCARTLVLLAVTVFLGCGRKGAEPEPEPEPAVSATVPMPELLPGLRELTVDDPALAWSEAAGFVLMEPPVHLPTAKGGATRVAVFVSLPEDSRIEVQKEGPWRSPTLHLPAGTVADRVEYVRHGRSKSPDEGEEIGAWTVGDVRGGAITEDGQVFHVLRPTQPGRDAALFGYEWKRGETQLRTRAHERIAHAMRFEGAGFVTAHENPERGAKHFVELGQCDGCHLRDKPEYRTRGDIGGPEMWRPNRPSDAAGYYSILAVLSDSMVLEGGRPMDHNADDPLVTVRCRKGEPELNEDKKAGTRRYSCADDSLPVGERDVARGLAQADLVTARLCAARRYLWEHMDRVGHEVFAAAFASCGLTQTEGKEPG